MLTYRAGSAGSGHGVRNMVEHLLQQTLTPEMADYYEQGVAPPTAATAAASRYVRHIVDGQLQPGTVLDALVNVEAVRLACLARASLMTFWPPRRKPSFSL
jgi:hypothetical protein